MAFQAFSDRLYFSPDISNRKIRYIFRLNHLLVKGMKKFDQFSGLFQWSISILLGLIMVVGLFFWTELMRTSKIWMLLIFVVAPIVQFLITPLFSVLRVYNYHSPMVVSVGNNRRMISLHNGTSFDYLMEMSGIQPGIQWRNKMLYYYLDALLNIICQVENGNLPSNTVIRGSSYFLSQRSAVKLGFEVKHTSILEKINIALNYIDVVWMYSMANRKLTFPNLTKIITVRTTGEELIKHKTSIMALSSRLERNPEK